MLGIRRNANDDSSDDRRALVPVSVAVLPYNNVDLLVDDEDNNNQGDEDENPDLDPAPNWCYREVFAQRRKYMLVIITFGILLLLSMFTGIVFLVVRTSTEPVIPPTIPPVIPTTARTTPITTSAASTTTTTKTTTKPTSTTTQKPGPAIPTVHPLPDRPIDLPPSTLIQQVFYNYQINYTRVECTPWIPTTFKYTLKIKGVAGIFSGESNSKIHAKTAASKSAAESMFGLNYGDRYPTPEAPHPCFENGTLLTFPQTPILEKGNGTEL